MVRLTRLRIDRFRNVKPGTELRFGPTFNVLLGKNATGKSTLLDLIAAVTNDDLSSYAQEDAGFDLTWSLEHGQGQLEVRAVRTPVESRGLPERVREKKDFDDAWTMMLRHGNAEAGQLEITGGHGIWKPHEGPQASFPVRTDLADRGAGEWALIAAYQKYLKTEAPRVREAPATAGLRAALNLFVVHGRVDRFDEALVAFDTMMRSYFELIRELSSSSSSSSGTSSSADWIPMDLIRAQRSSDSADSGGVPFDEIESLAKSPALLGFASATLYPRVLTRSQDDKRVMTAYRGFDCLFRRADGSQISHELLSFGQKRLFSFLWYLAVRGKLPVVADELLNGLHHEWIEVCFDRLRDRQSFLATQHPLLLDHIPIESAEAVRTTFVRCSLERGPDGREQMSWRNFDEEEAERFFIAYQTGIQHVSEVLRSEGLW